MVNPYARRADLPRQPDTHAPRSHEVPDADPLRSRCCTSTSDPSRPRRGARASSISKSRRPISPWPTGWSQEVLGRSLDELPPQTRRMLLLIDEMVTAQCQRLKMERTDFRFSRREVRHSTGWSDTQVAHLHRLRGDSNICSCIAADAARASFTSSVRAARAMAASPCCPAYRRGKTRRVEVRRQTRRGASRGEAGPDGPKSGGCGEWSVRRANNNGHCERFSGADSGGND